LIFVDASVLAAIINEEPDAADLVLRLGAAGTVFVSPMVRFEAVLAVARASSAMTGRPVTAETLLKAGDLVDALIGEFDAQFVDLTAQTGTDALDAARRYGKVVRHPARLNLGDCFAYACAKHLGAPLLYKGGDFAQTDLA